MAADTTKTVSTLTLRLNGKDLELLEKIKKEQGQNVSSKALLSLLLYPDRYRDKENENKKLRAELQNQKEQIKALSKEKESIEESKNQEIKTLKEGICNFIHSFEQLRNL